MTCSTEPYGVTAKFGLHNKPVNAMWEFSKVITVPWLCNFVVHLPRLCAQHVAHHGLTQ